MKRDFRNNVLPQDVSLRDILLIWNRNPIGVALLVDDTERLQGILTDGDVRRLMLRGVSLDEAAEHHMTRDFVYGLAAHPPEQNIALLDEHIRHLPIVDDEKRVVDFMALADFSPVPLTQPMLTGNEMAYVVDCIKTNWISSQGEYVRKFEESFAAYHGGVHAVTTSNGTTALHLALLAVGVGPGDEVIVPDLTFAASANAVFHCGAVPVLVDVTPGYWNLDPTKLESAITSRTKAVMPVHLYGHPCDMDPIMEIARRRGLKVVEDAAEALGAKYKGRLAGTIGDVGCFSFFSNKVVTTGEGGMVIAQAPDVAERVRLLRDHGMRRERRYWHEVVGYNYRLTNIQAALGLAQMERVDVFLERRKILAREYARHLTGLPGIILPPEMSWAENIYWLYSICIDACVTGIGRDQLMQALQAEGVETRPFFHPLHRQPPYANCGGPCPVSAAIADSGLSLPSGGSLTRREVETVCKRLRTIVSNTQKFSSEIHPAAGAST